ncbi:MAG: bifunctional phosphopantothenoylcysteine decarboxylase/phosphopantothenate--cysteine ligase CoaBC [Gammaproteobacteria bacterium]|nr:bifunctional phosphopantothenoylcysteine decarboxylase/phosphopantothenate--cysteine ligase CoaBC [Gammaproteobacteria bacterium]MDH4315962.1 bifunctional phosphopantothenoylcysteine decarboxylase/phosphopantothenate--cysteine ligase CoaBC [Gammaproteobacteria bacterium]MDH5215390.1 bifunctional phosphopantothenoylcysteine decarboxylase/phosphopantothenate--cysteine ligase CoaBC [Gammaproteobacteria bacterium]MDH5501650.1 bifunctional phosphopantothenoylcysteine decarboxylase/phosphopantothen
MTRSKILLGVTGGIAAYKAPELVRRLTERGAVVQVVMTRGAHEFTTETALQAVSGRPVRSDLWDSDAEAAMGHIELARWADRILVAPATAEFMSRLATGSAADLLTTLCIASEAPIFIAPAMNHIMWANPAVQANRRLLESRGVTLLGPDVGDQACGETGPGRMLQPEAIARQLLAPAIVPATHERPLLEKTVMVTAGPTVEAIDPVRFISNRSSGKMGYALARAAAAAGAKVILVSGPVDLPAPEGVQRIDIESAEDLYAATHKHIAGVDIFIAAAAVSDYRPGNVAANKIKKMNSELHIELVRSPDILASVAELTDGPFTVGFAAETENLREHAMQKLVSKKLDMIVANKVGPGIGFDSDNNAVDVFWRDGERSFPLSPKADLAVALIGLVAERFSASYGADTQTELPAIAIRE